MIYFRRGLARVVCSIALCLISFSAYTNEPNTDADFPILEGEGLTVQAPRTHGEPGSIVVGRTEIEQSNARDLIDLIAETTGLATTSNGGYGTVSAISIRGLTTSHIRVRVDGVIVNSPQSGDFDFSTINKNSIENITIHYGDSAIVTVDIVTRKKANAGLTWSTGFSNTAFVPPGEASSLVDAQRADFSLAWGSLPINARLDIFATRAQNQFPTTKNKNTIMRTGNEMLDGGLFGAASIFLADHLTLDVSGSVYYADKNVAGSINSLSTGKQKDFRSMESIVLSADRIFSKKTSADFSLTHTYNSLSWNDAAADSLHKLHSLETATSWDISLSNSFTTHFRGSWNHDSLDSTNTNGVTRDTFTLDTKAQYHFENELSTQIACTLIASPSLKLPQAVPSLTLSLPFGKNNDGGISVYRSFKRPNLNDLYWSGDATAQGNPDLKNEKSWGAQVFFNQNRPGLFNSSHSLYGNWYSNAIIWQSSSGVWSPENVGEAVYLGSDHRLTFTPGNRITLSLTYSYLFTRVLTGWFTFADKKSMAYQPEHKFSLNIRKTAEKYSWYCAPRYEGKRFVTIMNVAELPSVFTLDGGLTLYPSKTVSVFFDGNNLFNEQWMSLDGYPMPSRSVTIGITITGG